MRKEKIDYLLYRIIDTIVDNYFAILDKLEEEIEVIEDNIISETSKKTIKSIQTLKRNMINFRKTVRPLREILNSLIRDMSDYLSDSILYFRDTYDHVIQIIEELESIRDQLSSTLDIFLTTVNNKINHVMKILTVISTIFMPITFISGIYGINFKYMPELYWKWSY
ncbi:CorA family divalent cation transporter [Thermosipho africanus]|uniref:CorA family divalent cation transporter n=1 Tax=Thermosipho africanus TaxID=2421 RepID=UPI0022B75CFB|nr:CorA family divalent cation transporter [Thermosipho africanus]